MDSMIEIFLHTKRNRTSLLPPYARNPKFKSLWGNIFSSNSSAGLVVRQNEFLYSRL